MELDILKVGCVCRVYILKVFTCASYGVLLGVSGRVVPGALAGDYLGAQAGDGGGDFA